MKILFQITFLLFSFTAVNAQQEDINQLKKELLAATNDTSKLFLQNDIVEFYSEINPDSTYRYAEMAKTTAQKLQLKLEEAHALGKMGYALINKGNYPRALQNFLSAVAIAENPDCEKKILNKHYPVPDEFTDRGIAPEKQRLDKLSHIYQYMGILYSNMTNLEKATQLEKQSLALAEQTNNIKLQCITNSALGRIYLLAKKTDSALFFQTKAYEQAVQEKYERYLGTIFLNTGRAWLAKGNQQEAAAYFKKAADASIQQKYFRGYVASKLLLADYYKQARQKDSVLTNIKSALTMAQTLDAPDLLLRCYRSLATYYNNNNDSLVKYQELIIKINDSLFNSKLVQQFQNIDYDEQQRQMSLEKEKETLRTSIKMYALLSGLVVLLAVAIILYRNNRQKHIANKKLGETLANLQSTQAQLVQSEKMASLGELTAGIAHEIQNPLNFVNNFSEVSSELLGEMNDEINKGNYDIAREIASDVKQNLEKITHHGKRAGDIVKGMLAHSRSSTGQKELTDINALCDEYLRLSYHGLRAKNKSFIAKFETDFDNSIGKINIVPQEIGRVILNLINNAFYAVNEKKKNMAESFEPTVSVSTKKTGADNVIAVKDNGTGIPQGAIDKIFQPFYTTKPTGQGTGLGLSLSYDIIKAHGGELKVETKEGAGTTFIITLPS